MIYVTPPEETERLERGGHQRAGASFEPHLARLRTLLRGTPRKRRARAAAGSKRRGEGVAASGARRGQIGNRRDAHRGAFITIRRSLKLDELVNAITVWSGTAAESAVTAYAVWGVADPHCALRAAHRGGALGTIRSHDLGAPRARICSPTIRALAVDEVTLVVQVNGKVRARIVVAPGIGEEQSLRTRTRGSERSQVTSTARRCVNGSTFRVSCSTSSFMNQPQIILDPGLRRGRGPGGMMLGLLLARAGVDVVVLEKYRISFATFGATRFIRRPWI